MDANGERLIVGRGPTKVVPFTEEDLAQRQKDHDKWVAKVEAKRNAPEPMDPVKEIEALKATVAELSAKLEQRDQVENPEADGKV